MRIRSWSSPCCPKKRTECKNIVPSSAVGRLIHYRAGLDGYFASWRYFSIVSRQAFGKLLNSYLKHWMKPMRTYSVESPRLARLTPIACYSVSWLPSVRFVSKSLEKSLQWTLVRLRERFRDTTRIGGRMTKYRPCYLLHAQVWLPLSMTAVLRSFSGRPNFAFLCQGVLDVGSPHMLTWRSLSTSDSSHASAHHPHAGLSRQSSPVGRMHEE